MVCKNFFLFIVVLISHNFEIRSFIPRSHFNRWSRQRNQQTHRDGEESLSCYEQQSLVTRRYGGTNKEDEFQP